MAVIDFFTGRSSAAPSRLVALREALREAQRRRSAYRRTFDELHALSERELADLGISRADIPAVAAQAARSL